MKARIIFTVLFLVLMSGCAGMKAQDRISRLETSLESYGAAIRWARYTDAYAFHLGKDGFRPPLELEEYDGIRVTNYQILEQTLSADQMEATVIAKISFYNDQTGVVTDIKHIQNWWYREEGRRWLVDATFPKFK